MYLQNASEKPATLGRALIISNTCNNTREGSEHDYHNIKQMLDKFGLITVGEHRNYSAQVGRLKPWSDVVLDDQLNFIINYNYKYIRCPGAKMSQQPLPKKLRQRHEIHNI